VLTAYNIGWPHTWVRSALTDEVIHSLLLWCYFAAVAQFACIFLSLRHAQKRLYRSILVLVALNGIGIFGENCLGDAWPFFLVDEILQDGLLGALIVAGVVMARSGLRSARFFLIAFLGVALGIVTADLAQHELISNASFFVRYSLELGIAFEAMFLALALADRTHRLDEERRRLEVLVDIDPLTALANRRGFDAALRREWQRDARSQSPLSILMADVDRFKQYNDRFGHVAGDEVLRRVAAALRGQVRRADDLAARYGGEEFAIVLSATNSDDALVLAERCRAAVEQLGIAHPENAGGVVTVSIGLATCIPVYDASPRGLVVDADAALYHAKSAGRNRVFTGASVLTS